MAFLGRLAVIYVLLGGCAPSDAPAKEPPPPPRIENTCDAVDPLVHCDKSDPVVCRVDTDCATASCGPCGSGDVITHRDLELDCVIASCTTPAFCSPEHVCKVR